MPKKLSFKKINATFDRTLKDMANADMQKEIVAISDMIEALTQQIHRLKAENTIMNYVSEQCPTIIKSGNNWHITVNNHKGVNTAIQRDLFEAYREMYAILLEIKPSEVKNDG